MKLSRSGQVCESLGEEQEEAVHTRAEETNGRALAPDVVSLLPHLPFEPSPLCFVMLLEFFRVFLLETNLL